MTKILFALVCFSLAGCACSKNQPGDGSCHSACECRTKDHKGSCKCCEPHCDCRTGSCGQ